MAVIDVTVTVEVKLLGVFQEILKNKQMYVTVKRSGTIERVLKKLNESISEEHGQLSFPNLSDHFGKALILVNGREMGVLHGFDTCLKQGDRLTIIPISHGG